MHCPVLICFVLYCPKQYSFVFSIAVLSYSVLPCPVLSCFKLYCVRPDSYHHVLHWPVLKYTFLSYTSLSHTLQKCSELTQTLLNYTVLSCVFLHSSVLSCVVLNCPNPALRWPLMLCCIVQCFNVLWSIFDVRQWCDVLYYVCTVSLVLC